jgi:hypothetical protein
LQACSTLFHRIDTQVNDSTRQYEMSNNLETHAQTFFVNSRDVVPEHAVVLKVDGKGSTRQSELDKRTQSFCSREKLFAVPNFKEPWFYSKLISSVRNERCLSVYR